MSGPNYSSTPFPADVSGGGKGVFVAADTNTGTILNAIVGEGTNLYFTNDGDFTAHVGWGDSSMPDVDNTYFPVLPGTQIVHTIKSERGPTHFKVRADGPAKFSCHRGTGI